MACQFLPADMCRMVTLHGLGAGRTVNVRTEVRTARAGTAWEDSMSPGFQADTWEKGLLEMHSPPRVSSGHGRVEAVTCHLTSRSANPSGRR